MSRLIAERIAPWKEVGILQEVFRSRDSEIVAQTVYDFCQKELGQHPAEALFFYASIGAVFGLQMQDGQRIVIKVHNAEHSLPFLIQIGKVQQYLADQEYPCPRPLAAPLPLAYGLATIDELIDEGHPRDAHEPAIRKALASAFFRHIDLLRNVEQEIDIDLTLFDRRLPPDVLWPKPHNVIFNFNATCEGAEWIDDLAWKAKKIIAQDHQPPVLGHSDFSVNQMRFVGDRLRIVYDWDSLTLQSELLHVGSTASSCTYTEQPGISNTGTSREDALAFIADYEGARQKRFTTAEQKIIQARMLAGELYGDRCQHTLHPEKRAFPRKWYEDKLREYQSIF